MSLSRKNYESIAAELCERITTCDDHLTGEQYEGEWWDGYVGAVEDTARSLAAYFAADNERFDRDRFLKACGVQA